MSTTDFLDTFPFHHEGPGFTVTYGLCSGGPHGLLVIQVDEDTQPFHPSDVDTALEIMAALCYRLVGLNKGHHVWQYMTAVLEYRVTALEAGMVPQPRLDA